MKMGVSLALIGIGAILAFAVTANTSVFNLHTAGWVCIAIGIIGLYLRRRGWVGKQILVRRTRSLRGRVIEDVPVAPSVDDTVVDRQTVPIYRPDTESDTEIVEEQEYRPE